MDGINSMISQFIKTPSNMFEFVGNLIVGLCVAALFISVLTDFIIYGGRNNGVRQEKKSIVETGTMVLFFIFFYYLVRARIGVLTIDFLPLRHIIAVIGLILIMLGCIVNISGRFSLGRNWTKQIKIYSDHTLVQSGVYSIVRHPLYASIIWMFYGACLVYLSSAAFAANTLIFVPFMYYRARQEEELWFIHKFCDTVSLP